MPRLLLALLLIPFSLGMLRGEGPVIDPMDRMTFHAPKEKGRAELVPGKEGQAIRLTFDQDSRGVFFTSNIHGKPAWDRAAGFSFRVKGDGSDHFGGLELIYDEDYSLRYDYAFPLRSTEWTRVTVAWGDLIPVLPSPKALPLDPAHGNKPSKISGVWFGKWWYWGDYPAESFAIDDLRLEQRIERDTRDDKPSGPPLRRVLAKLKAGKPVTIVTMGDSLTDFRHWSNRQDPWPLLLKKKLQDKYGSEVTIVNPAIGGTQLRQNLVLMPRWLARAPEPDLVTVCFGFNDWEAGMRGDQFRAACADAIDRIRRATKGKADVLLMTTLPAPARWTTMEELADACRAAARDRNSGLADTAAAFHREGRQDRERLYAWDRTHLGPAGHELMARTVLEAIETGGGRQSRSEGTKEGLR